MVARLKMNRPRTDAVVKQLSPHRESFGSAGMNVLYDGQVCRHRHQ
jgi:hypothetical protein